MNPLKPSAQLLIALGSLIVHYEELISPDGRELDKQVIDELRSRPEISEWFTEMDRMSFLPVKRQSGLTMRAADALESVQKMARGATRRR